MGDLAILVIWFASVISGMLLTMLLPNIFPDSRAHLNEAARSKLWSLTELNSAGFSEGEASPVASYGECHVQWDGVARVPLHDLHVEVFEGRRTSLILVEEEVCILRPAGVVLHAAREVKIPRYNESLDDV